MLTFVIEFKSSNNGQTLQNRLLLIIFITPQENLCLRAGPIKQIS